MKARITFDSTVEFRDTLIEISKRKHTHLGPMIRKVLRDYISKFYQVMERIPTKEEEAVLHFFPYTADEGETGDNLQSSLENDVPYLYKDKKNE